MSQPGHSACLETSFFATPCSSIKAVNVHYTGTSDVGWSRKKLLGWVNDTLQLNYTKVEEMGNGRRRNSTKNDLYNHGCTSRCRLLPVHANAFPWYSALRPSSAVTASSPAEAQLRLGKVKMDAEFEHHCTDNFKFLQECFKKMTVNKVSQ